MFDKHILASVSLALFTHVAAQAQDATQEPVPMTAPSLTRAQVQADLMAARRNGDGQERGESYGSIGLSKALSTRSRAEVRAELNMARAAGTLEERSEAYGGLSSKHFASTRTRAEVRAEAQAASRDRLSQGGVTHLGRDPG